MSRPQVFITDFINDDLHLEREELAGVADVSALGASNEAELVGRVESAAALMLYHDLTLSEATIHRLRQCRLIVRCGVGYDNVNLAAAKAKGIAVANVPDYGAEEVADSAIGMALTLTRGIHYLNSRLQKQLGPWSYEQIAPLHRLRGRVFGIIGLGRIGTAAAVRAKSLGMHVLFYDPYKPDGYDKALGITRAKTLTDLLRQSMIVSVHCPRTPETIGMLDGAMLRQMPMGSYLVNTARGGVVRTEVIPDLIAEGRLAGAGIDVLPIEPPAADDPLIAAWRDPKHPAHDRLIVNPHSAFYCEEGFEEMRRKGSRACRAAILGEPIPNRVDG